MTNVHIIELSTILHRKQNYFDDVQYDLRTPANIFDNEKKIALLKNMYIFQDMTVREICTHFEVDYEPRIQKLFYKVFGAKGKGHGGQRKNSGNKKGIIFNKK
jgi:uncharacterized protein YeeX (DUF496 family)